MFKAIIVEDQHNTRELLKDIINNELKNEIEVIGEAESIEEAKKLIEAFHPTLLLLDIQLTDGTGLELINIINKPEIPTIFITSHQEYAIEAINSELFIVDYILKPIGIENLINSVNRIKEKRKKVNQSKTRTKNIILRTKEKSAVINKNHIIYIKANNRYSIIKTITEEIKTAKTLKEMDFLLKEESFLFRINKTYIINLNLLTTINNNKTITLSNNINIPITPIAKKRLTKILSVM